MEHKTLFEECVEQYVTPEIERQVELSAQVATRLIDILIERKMSQKDFAKLMGKTETEISRWLMGTHNFTFATIAKIEVALGVGLLFVNSPVKVKPIMVNTQTFFEQSWQGERIKDEYLKVA